MRTLAALLLLTAACHEPEGELWPTATTSATSPSSSAASSAPSLVKSSGSKANPDDEIGLSGIGEGGGIVRSGDPGFDRFAYGTDPRKPTGVVVRMGAVTVTGRLPPEVIKRIVRQNFGRLRACYQPLLIKNPNLSAGASTSFTIDASGSPRGAKTTGEITDRPTMLCIERTFSALSFPQPEGGVVRVVYPLTFGPPEYKFTISDKSSILVQEADLVKALEAAGYKVSGAAEASQPSASVSRFKAEKGGVTFSITLDPDARLPLESYRKLSKEAVALEDGSWGLFVESSDKTASQALIDAIRRKPETK